MVDLVELSYTLNESIKKMESAKTVKGLLEKQKKEAEDSYAELTEKAELYSKAASLLSTVAEKAQEAVINHFSTAGSFILQDIFGPGYKFAIELSKSSYQSASMSFIIESPYEGNDVLSVDPVHGDAGGLRDVIGFALRTAFLNLAHNKGIIFLDECFSQLSESYIDSAAKALDIITEKLGYQVMFITHDSKFIDSADNTIKIDMKGSSSYATSI